MNADSTPGEVLKEKAWRGAFLFALVVAALAAGYTLGYLRTDVVALRATLEHQRAQIHEFQRDCECSHRGSPSGRLAKMTRDKEVCEKDLEACKKGLSGDSDNPLAPRGGAGAGAAGR